MNSKLRPESADVQRYLIANPVYAIAFATAEILLGDNVFLDRIDASGWNDRPWKG